MSKAYQIHFTLSLTLFIVGFIPRLMWALADHPQPFSDMEDYYLCAVHLIREGYLGQSPDRLAYRPPLYPILIYAIVQLFEHPLVTLRIIQAILGSFTITLIYALAYQLFLLSKPKTIFIFKYLFPLFSALTYAFLQHAIFFTGIVMSETLYIFLLMLWFYLLIFTSSKKTFICLSISSILLGLLALIRPISMIFFPIILFQIWKLIPKEKRLQQLSLPTCGWLLPILPWTIRNCIIFGTFVFITTNSGVNFFIGHSPAFGYYEQGLKEPLRQYYAQTYGYSEVGEDRFLFQMGLRSIYENPSACLSRSFYKLYFLYWLEIQPWPFDEYPHQYLTTLPWPMISWNHWFVIFALFGFFFATIKKMPHFPLLFVILLYTIAILIFFARTRFRMPIEPILIIYLWIFILSLVEWGYIRYLYWRRQF